MQPYGGGQLPWPATSNSASKPPATDKNKKKKKKKKKWLRWAIPLAVVVIAITILGACLGTQLNKHPKATPMRLGNGTSESPTDLQDTNGNQAGVGDNHRHHNSSDGVPRVELPSRGVPSGSSLPQPVSPVVPVSPVAPANTIAPVPSITPTIPTNAPLPTSQTQTQATTPTTTNPIFTILPINPINPITPIPIPIPIPIPTLTTLQTQQLHPAPTNNLNPNATTTKVTAPPTKLTALPMTAAGDEDCTTLHGITYTFYGYPDNDPPGAAIAYECPGRGPTAGGTGTYDDPLTFATAPGEFELCEVIYSPYLQKYLIHEDYCASCTRHWPHMWHVDVWLGGDSVGAAAEQLSCEARLTPALESQSVVRGPRGDLVVDDTTFYAGGYSACGVDHVYDAAGGADDYC